MFAGKWPTTNSVDSSRLRRNDKGNGGRGSDRVPLWVIAAFPQQPQLAAIGLNQQTLLAAGIVPGIERWPLEKLGRWERTFEATRAVAKEGRKRQARRSSALLPPSRPVRDALTHWLRARDIETQVCYALARPGTFDQICPVWIPARAVRGTCAERLERA